MGGTPERTPPPGALSDERPWALEVPLLIPSRSDVDLGASAWVPEVAFVAVVLQTSPAENMFSLLQHCWYRLKTDDDRSAPSLAPLACEPL